MFCAALNCPDALNPPILSLRGSALSTSSVERCKLRIITHRGPHRSVEMLKQVVGFLDEGFRLVKDRNARITEWLFSAQ